MTDWFKTPEQLEQENQQRENKYRIRELQKLLDDTDHKFYGDYEPKEGEDLDAIKANRSEWRAEIRDLIESLPEGPEDAPDS